MKRFFEKPQVTLTNLVKNSLNFGSVKRSFMKLLNKVATLKSKFLRATHSKFVTQDVSKAIMLRTKLENQFLKTGTVFKGATIKYNKQKNIYVSPAEKAKQNYYKN